MRDFSYITNSSPSFIESLYQDFINDPNSVDPEFRKFFEGFDFAMSNGKAGSNGAQLALGKDTSSKQVTSAEADWKREISIYRLILGYRNKGHLLAKTNPIRPRKDRGANLDLSFLGSQTRTLTRNFRQAACLAWEQHR